MSAVDGHENEAEPPSRSDVLPADAALDADDEHARSLAWTRAFFAERKGTAGDLMLDDVLEAARDAAIDEESVRRALDVMDVRTRRDGRIRRRSAAAAADVASPAEHVGRRKQKARRGEAATPLAPEEARSERQSNRAPGGKVRIVAVDLEPDGQPSDPLQPTSIVVRIRCDEPGQLQARVLVRDGQRGEVEAVAPVRDVDQPGVYALRCDIPANVLGGLKHSVDVETWLATAGGTYASMHVFAQRFKSRERSENRPLVHLDATWLEGHV
jgi:hypothetical protein